MKAYSASNFHGLHVRNTHCATSFGLFVVPPASYWSADVSGSIKVCRYPWRIMRLVSRTERTPFALFLAAHLCGRDLSRSVGVVRNPYIPYTATRARARSSWDRGRPVLETSLLLGFSGRHGDVGAGVRPLGAVSGSVHSRTGQRAHARRPLARASCPRNVPPFDRFRDAPGIHALQTQANFLRAWRTRHRGRLYGGKRQGRQRRDSEAPWRGLRLPAHAV